MIKLIVIFMALLTGCSSTVNNSGDITKTDTNIIYAYIDDNILEINLEDNSSAEAFLKHLKENDIVVDMSDYGGFEKVGDLGFNLPRNDTDINATSGDVILYQGNSITIYYGNNYWNFTKLGKIENVSQDKLKNILGDYNIKVRFSLD